MSKYLIVLFKNKVRKKIIKKYQNGKPAMNFFNNLISENEKVVLPREVENTVDSNYEVAVLEKNSQRLLPTYMTDEFGRNIKVKLENPDYNIIKISPYRYPETIFDIERNKKITVDFFLNRYLPKVGVKVMSVLNNKIIIQNDDEVRLFSLKSENEAERFIAEISLLFFKNKRGDCLFVTDTSSPQRKYLFQFLESKGFDKKILYRKFTTHPRHLPPK
jgi:hypothetical protein